MVRVAAQVSSVCWFRYVSNGVSVMVAVFVVIIRNDDYNDELPKCKATNAVR